MIEECSGFGFDDRIERAARSACNHWEPARLGFDGRDSKILDLGLEKDLICAKKCENLWVVGVAMECDVRVVFVDSFECAQMRSRTRDVDGLLQQQCRFNRKINPFVRLNRTDIQQPIVAGCVVVGGIVGGGEVVGPHGWMDHHCVTLVSVSDLVGNKVRVGDELGDMGCGASVPVAEPVAEVVQAGGAEFGFETGLGRVLIGL